jgi:tetratricopeptide (TPR) repeat protein
VDFFTRSLAEEDSNFAVGQRATCEADMGKYDAALADSAAALKKDPQWMNHRILRANIFIRRGDHAGVAAEAEALLHENPKSDFALVAAAKTYAALDQRQRAMQLFDQAIAIKPTALTYVNRSQVRPASDITGKMADLDAALRLEPDNVDAIAVKADLLSKQGKQADALALLDRLPKSTADEAWVQRLQAVMLYKAGRTAEAQKRFADLGTKSKTASEFNSLCWMKATAGMLLESALSDCQNALKMSPDSGPYLDSLGMVLLKLGKLDEALDAYTKAIAKNTGADSLMGRAFVYMRKGDRAHADADAAAARKLYAMIDDTFAEYGLKFDDKSARAATAK